MAQCRMALLLLMVGIAAVESSPWVPKITTTSQDTIITASPAVSPEDICKKPGLNADPNDCAVIYLCKKDDSGQWEVEQFKCVAGTVYDPTTESCTWASDVPGCEDYYGNSTTSTTEISTMPPDTTTTSSPTLSPNDICKKPGMNADPNDCAVFYLCNKDDSGQWQMTQFRCGAGTVFDPVEGDCTLPCYVPGCEDYQVNSTTSTPEMSTTPQDTTTTSSPTMSPDDICKKPGMNADPNDCAVFYLCKKDDSGQWEVTKFKCGAGSVYDPTTESCTWASDVPGCEDYYGNSTTSTTEISTTPQGTTSSFIQTLSPDDICKKPGMNADPNDCAVFYLCKKDDAGQWQITQFRCGAGTVFDPVGGVCTLPSYVPGCEDYGRRKSVFTSN